MEVAYALLATAAEMTPDGRLHALNAGLDAIRVSSQGHPPPLHLAAKFVFSAEEWGREHDIAIEFIAPDGAVIEQVANKVTVQPAQAPATRASLGMVVVVSAPFRVAGEYTARISMDAQPMKTIPFQVVLDTAQQRTAEEVRAEWMRLLGMPEDEIAEACRPDGDNPLNLEEELRELEAAQKVKRTAPTYEQLRTWAQEAAHPVQG